MHISVGDRVWLTKNYVVNYLIVDHKECDCNPHYLPRFTIVHTGTVSDVLAHKFDVDPAFYGILSIADVCDGVADAASADLCGRYTVTVVNENHKHVIIRLRNKELDKDIYGHGEPIKCVEDICKNGGTIQCGGYSNCGDRTESYSMSVAVDAGDGTGTVKLLVGARDTGFEEN